MIIRKLIRKVKIFETSLEVVGAALAVQHVSDEKFRPVLKVLSSVEKRNFDRL